MTTNADSSTFASNPFQIRCKSVPYIGGKDGHEKVKVKI